MIFGRDKINQNNNHKVYRVPQKLKMATYMAVGVLDRVNQRARRRERVFFAELHPPL